MQRFVHAGVASGDAATRFQAAAAWHGWRLLHTTRRRRLLLRQWLKALEEEHEEKFEEETESEEETEPEEETESEEDQDDVEALEGSICP